MGRLAWASEAVGASETEIHYFFFYVRTVGTKSKILSEEGTHCFFVFAVDVRVFGLVGGVMEGLTEAAEKKKKKRGLVAAITPKYYTTSITVIMRWMVLVLNNNNKKNQYCCPPLPLFSLLIFYRSISLLSLGLV